MNSSPCSWSMMTLVLLLFFVVVSVEQRVVSGQLSVSCTRKGSKCFAKKVKCPAECPNPQPSNPNAKACFLDCNSPKCETVCRRRKPNCNGLGTGCFDPRFIGGDGVVFYFHGRRGEHFALVSDPGFQINARFIGLRPAGRERDFTWIQALGILFGRYSLTVEAAPAAQWDEGVDHLHFTYDGDKLVLPEGHLTRWSSHGSEVTIERTAATNSVSITFDGIAEVAVRAVPVTEEDNRIHHYGIPANNRYVHLEVQFRFVTLSPEVEGVLGRTYQPNFSNTAKPGVAMPVVGGEDKYRTSSLLSPDCKLCLFAPQDADQ